MDDDLFSGEEVESVDRSRLGSSDARVSSGLDGRGLNIEKAYENVDSKSFGNGQINGSASPAMKDSKRREGVTTLIGEPTDDMFYNLQILEPVMNPFIPHGHSYRPQKVEGQFTDLEIATFVLQKNERPLLLEGPAGCGKNKLINTLCQETHRPVYRCSLYGGVSYEEIVGYPQPTKEGFSWIDGPLTMAVRHGWTIIFDEINAAEPEVLFVIQTLVEGKGSPLSIGYTGEVIIPHSQFRLVATMNPTEEGMYSGTSSMNAATMDRFYKMKLGYMRRADEIKHLRKKFPYVPEDEIRAIVKFANQMRSSVANDLTNVLITTRTLEKWCEMAELMGPVSAGRALIKGMASADERDSILDAMEREIGERRD